MNKLLHLVFIDFKLLTKSKTFYLKLILFPAVLILILGTVLGGSSTKLPAFNVAFYSEDSCVTQGNNSLSLGTTLGDKVLKSKDLKSIITLKKVENYKEGTTLVEEGKVSVFVYVPRDFTKSFLSDTKTGITLLGNKNNPIDKSIIKSILDGFISNTKTVFIEEKEVASMQNSNNVLSEAAMGKIIKHIESQNTASTIISKVSTNSKETPISGMQYYSIAMIVMFSITTAFTLVHSIVDDRLNNTLFRIKSTPTLNLQYAMGKLIGIIFAVAMQMTMVIITTGIVFRMKWGNVFDILLITIVYAFAIGAMILLWGLTAKDQSSVSSMSAPILYGFSFLGGSLISKYSLPDSLKIIQQIIPNGKAINSYLIVCEGGGIGDIYMDLIELMLIGTVFLIIALIVYNGRVWINNANATNGKKAAKTIV